MQDEDVSLRGLDDFSKRFLLSSTAEQGEEEYIHIAGGQQASKEAISNYFKERTEDFIKRAGSFTDDLVAFVVEQKKLRGLSDVETIFGLALANINLRNAYTSPQGDEKDLTSEMRQAYLDKFDEICWGAQQYWDANKDG